MEESDFEFENDTDSMFDSFDLPQYNVNGLRIFLGLRRESSIEVGNRQEWITFDRESEVGGDDENEDDSSEDGESEDSSSEDDPCALPRGFVDRRDPVAEPMGQAIDLALRLLETQKSIDIMAGVAKRLVDDSPEDIQHITSQSTLRECKTLVRHWITKLRQQEFFKIQAIVMDDGSKVGSRLRCWHRRVHSEDALTLPDYHPHNAGLLEIDIEVLWVLFAEDQQEVTDIKPQIIRKLTYHASSSHAGSSIELQKCLFHVANLLTHEVQRFWVAFLMSDMAKGGTQAPVAMYSDATIHLMDYFPEPSAGYHWELEFLGGSVRWLYNQNSPDADFDDTGGFGRGLSSGDAYLQRADGTEQQIAMDSIIGCVEHGEQ